MKKLTKVLLPIYCVSSLLAGCAQPPDPYASYRIPYEAIEAPDAQLFFQQAREYLIGRSAEEAVRIFRLPPEDRHWQGTPFQSDLLMTLPSGPQTTEGCHLQLLVKDGRVAEVVSSHSRAEMAINRIGRCYYSFEILNRYVTTGVTQTEYWDSERRRLRDHYERIAKRRHLELLSADPDSQYILFAYRNIKRLPAENAIRATLLFHLTSPSALENGATFRSIRERVRINCGVGDAVVESMGYYSGEYADGLYFNPPPGEPKVLPLFGAEKELCRRYGY